MNNALKVDNIANLKSARRSGRGRLRRSAAESLCDFCGDFAVAVIEIIAGARLVCKPAVNGQNHLAGLRHIGKRLVLIAEPQELALTVSLANIGTEVKQGGKSLVLYGVGVERIARHFDSDGAVVVRAAGRAPGAVFLLAIHTDAAVGAYAVVAACLPAGRLEYAAQSFNGTLSHDAMNRDSIDCAVAGTRFVRANIGMDYQRAVTHLRRPPFRWRARLRSPP